jgi:hemerythrin
MARTWNDSLKIGIPLLDIQHEQLLDQMDQLLEAMEKDKHTAELKSIMGFLKMYVNNHFNYEESCMTLHKCPVACKNQEAHARFSNTLADINDKIEANLPGMSISYLVKKELLDWFVNHIKSIDRQLEASIQVNESLS